MNYEGGALNFGQQIGYVDIVGSLEERTDRFGSGGLPHLRCPVASLLSLREAHHEVCHSLGIQYPIPIDEFSYRTSSMRTSDVGSSGRGMPEDESCHLVRMTRGVRNRCRPGRRPAKQGDPLEIDALYNRLQI